MTVRLRIDGLEHLNGKLKRLSEAVEGSKVEDLLLKAARPIADQARRWAPVGLTKALQKALVAKKLQRKGRKTAPVIAAVDRKLAPHAHLVEFGTAQRQHKSGKSTGAAPADPFFRPAVDSKKGEAGQIITDGLRRLVEEASR